MWWCRRDRPAQTGRSDPLTREQLEYAADDVFVSRRSRRALTERLKDLGREQWASRGLCAALESRRPCTSRTCRKSWQRLRGIGQLEPKTAGPCQGRCRVARKAMARERDLPRAWIFAGRGDILHRTCRTRRRRGSGSGAAAQRAIRRRRAGRRCIRASGQMPLDEYRALARIQRPTPEQKALIDKLNEIGRRARRRTAELSAEVYWRRAANSRRSPWVNAIPCRRSSRMAPRSRSAFLYGDALETLAR